ncbi:inactive dipeptidyl peptidase 10-like isoform X2 [Ornithodoros turicata]|uniref:inactive dipeptidyl peptidase 10-like isoform X2 n=1 Tax=Ornithodoros turicata TaxID=34597 RepID=UPI003138B96F
MTSSSEPASAAKKKPSTSPAPPPPVPNPQDPNAELVSSAPDSRNWRGIGIALLVIAGVCALIVTAVILLSPGDKGPRVKQPRISLGDVLLGFFHPRRFNGSWVTDTEFIYRDTDGTLMLYNAETKEKKTLLFNTTFRKFDAKVYQMSPDRNFLLLTHDIKPVYRHTFLAKYEIYDFTSKDLFPLRHSPNHEELQYAAWGKTGSQLVYVFENDVYFISSVLGGAPVRVTQTGVPDVVFNGIPDWLYEEEVLSSPSAMWWSPKGQQLCLARFNDTGVRTISVPVYSTDDLYPGVRDLRYPKSGTANPTVDLFVASLGDLGTTGVKLKSVRPPRELLDRTKEYYVTFVAFLDEQSLVVNFLTRAQNWTQVSVCREGASTWDCAGQAVETASGGWIDLKEPPLVAAGGFFLKLPVQDQRRGNFKHLAAFQEKRKKFLTHGPYDIISILAYSPESKRVFFTSTREGKPGESHLYSVPFNDEETQPICHTCDLGDQCLYNNAVFSSESSRFYILECLGPGVPWVAVRKTSDHSQVEMLDANDELKERVEQRAMPQVRNFYAPLADGYNATVRLLLPPGLRDEEVLKYPFLVHVYGGPDTQQVTEQFRVTWGHSLASRKGVVFAMIDGRGSSRQGDRRLHQVYKRLGTVEVQDQLRVAKYLKAELPFISKEHTAIWGWSYGGYVAAMALAGGDAEPSSDDGVFQCGISVAPVTNWMYYDSAYTERFMGLPSDNVAAYDRSNLLLAVEKLRDKRFYLLHGTADDNVHFQHSMLLVKELTRRNIMHRTQVYPDENHSLGRVLQHLYHSMEDFLDECFEGSDHNVEEIGLMQVKASR